MRRVDLLYFKTQIIKDMKDISNIINHLFDISKDEDYYPEIIVEVGLCIKALDILLDNSHNLIRKVEEHYSADNEDS